MKRRRTLLFTALAVVAVVVLAVYGFLPDSVSRLVGVAPPHPPCGELPTREEVAEAISRHTTLVDELTAAGDGVEVTIGTPCPDTDQALVTVRVTNSEEEDAVREILGDSDGFGVPATVEKT